MVGFMINDRSMKLGASAQFQKVKNEKRIGRHSQKHITIFKKDEFDSDFNHRLDAM